MSNVVLCRSPAPKPHPVSFIVETDTSLVKSVRLNITESHYSMSLSNLIILVKLSIRYTLLHVRHILSCPKDSLPNQKHLNTLPKWPIVLTGSFPFGSNCEVPRCEVEGIKWNSAIRSICGTHGERWQVGNNRMTWQWTETLVEIRATLVDIRGTIK